MRTRIIFIGGYARSGKSSAISYLRNHHGLVCLSTSECLHQVKDRLLDTFPEIARPTNKEQERSLCIKIAEGLLVPIYGREIFANWVVQQIQPGQTYIVETIGGVEHTLLKDTIKRALTRVDIDEVNIRRGSERIGVDIRKLLENGIELYNNGTLDELYKKLDKLIRQREGGQRASTTFLTY